jgi:hypothetical protein
LCFHISIFRWLDLQGNAAVIRIYDTAGNVIETREHARVFKEWPAYYFGVPAKWLALPVASTSNESNKRKCRLEPSSALNQVNNQHDDRDNEQEVNQAPANMADEAKKPEHDQDDNYSPEHGYSFRLS